MTLIVADASALVEYLLRTARSEKVRPAFEADNVSVHVPSLCDVEVVAALRRALLLGRMPQTRAEEALEDYLDLSLTRHGHGALLDRILSLRDNFSAYDATYVALAEHLGAALLTADEGLLRAVQVHTAVPTAP